MRGLCRYSLGMEGRVWEDGWRSRGRGLDWGRGRGLVLRLLP